MIKIKISKNESKNTAKPIDRSRIQHNPTKISGYGASDEYTKITGQDFNPVTLPRHGMEDELEHEYELDECGCDDEGTEKIVGVIEPEEFDAEQPDIPLYEKKDRCYYQAKRKYKVFPSAYASGYIVRCRKGKVGRKNESLELTDELVEFILNEGTFDKEKSQGLHGWFARKGGKGKSKGWVDCNTCKTNPETGRKTCKSCGRQAGEKRGKYPACRPTPSACNRTGTKRKKSSKRVSWKPKKKEE